MKYNTAIFDLDGTLLNTLEDLADSVNFMLDKLQFPNKTLRHVQESIGNGISRLIELSIPKGMDNPLYKEAITVFKEHYTLNCQNKTAPYPQIMETIGALANKGVKMAIVSNKADSAVKLLNDAFFKAYIEVALGEQPGIPKKPAPDLVLKALNSLNSTKDKAIYFGDSDVDIETAKNTGIQCVSVTWGYREEKQLKAKGSTVFINQAKEILGFYGITCC